MIKQFVRIDRVPDSLCTRCGYHFDRAGSIDATNDMPRPGDLTVCFDCGHRMTYGDDLRVRDLTPAEQERAAGMPIFEEFEKLRRALALEKANKARKKADKARKKVIAGSSRA